MTNKITRELLKEWDACEDGFKRFCELFPEGATLEVAIKGLVDDGHDNWGKWLFDRSKENKLFEDITSKGYRNSGDYNSGDRNSGDRNSGDRNSGNYNSGDRNSGNYNSGYGSSGNRNSGIFCSVEPAQSLFNKPTELMFNSPEIQQIVGVINSVKSIMTWIYSDNMSDEEKANNPSHTTTGGYLKKQDFKYCWKKAWEGFSEDQKNIILNAPNFDAAVFEEITGVKVNE